MDMILRVTVFIPSDVLIFNEFFNVECTSSFALIYRLHGFDACQVQSISCWGVTFSSGSIIFEAESELNE